MNITYLLLKCLIKINHVPIYNNNNYVEFKFYTVQIICYIINMFRDTSRIKMYTWISIIIITINYIIIKIMINILVIT